jgi:pimeloyl-ACP methyl ester carboxylesterase
VGTGTARTARYAWLIALVALLGFAAPAMAKKAPSKKPPAKKVVHRATPSPVTGLHVSVSGGTPTFEYQMCGVDRTVPVVASNAAARATVRESLGRTSVRVRRHGRTVTVRRAASPVAATLQISICHDGTWHAFSTGALSRASSASHALNTATTASGDYRITATVSAAGHTVTAAPIYVRVGLGEIVDDPVTFTVSNQAITQSLAYTCAADGSSQVIHGHLIGPRADFVGNGSHDITLYLHGLGYGEWFWNFTAVPGYDWAMNMAYAGQTSLTIDRLGYGASGQPNGNDICLASQAFMAHQIIQDLLGANYSISSGPAPNFVNVVLAGHSIGGEIAELESWEYRDAAGLILMSWSDLGFSPQALSEFTSTTLGCEAGGIKSVGGSPGYEDFGMTTSAFDNDMFYNVDPAVEAAANSMREPDPCGDTGSALQTIVINRASASQITEPILLMFGDEDALFPPPAGAEAKAEFTGAASVTLDQDADTGHAVALGRTAPEVTNQTLAWLNAHNF